MGCELGLSAAQASPLCVHEGWTDRLGVHLEAQSWMEVKSDWTRLGFGADSVTHWLFAPEDFDLCLGTGDDGRGDRLLRFSLLSLLQTCDNQRKDSPVGVFILSPEPLQGEEVDRKEKTTKQKGGGKER